MKKGDIYEGTVEKIEFPNKGILHIDGERVVVKNAIPGQKIQCVITKRRKGKSEARTLEILAHSPAEKPEEACPIWIDAAGVYLARACPMKNS